MLTHLNLRLLAALVLGFALLWGASAQARGYTSHVPHRLHSAHHGYSRR